MSWLSFLLSISISYPVPPQTVQTSGPPPSSFLLPRRQATNPLLFTTARPESFQSNSKPTPSRPDSRPSLSWLFFFLLLRYVTLAPDLPRPQFLAPYKRPCRPRLLFVYLRPSILTSDLSRLGLHAVNLRSYYLPINPALRRPFSALSSTPSPALPDLFPAVDQL